MRLEKEELIRPKAKARSGFFGELSIPTSDLKASRAFWEKLGFTYFAFYADFDPEGGSYE